MIFTLFKIIGEICTLGLIIWLFHDRAKTGKQLEEAITILKVVDKENGYLFVHEFLDKLESEAGK
jgi:hypothetical protein